MTLINIKMQENKNFIYQFKKSLDEFRNSKIRGKLPDLSFSKLCAKIKDKTLKNAEIIDIFDDYVFFLTHTKTPHLKEYFGKYSPKVINLCFESYPETFDIEYFSMLENYKKADLIEDIYEKWKEKKTEVRPEYFKLLLNQVSRAKDYGISSQEELPLYQHEYGETTKAETKIDAL